jgi:hypothetical protein
MIMLPDVEIENCSQLYIQFVQCQAGTVTGPESTRPLHEKSVSHCRPFVMKELLNGIQHPGPKVLLFHQFRRALLIVRALIQFHNVHVKQRRCAEDEITHDQVKTAENLVNSFKKRISAFGI